MRRYLTALCAAALCGTALAQEPANPPPVEGTLDVTVVEELVAKPLTPGPAWWRVADADSAVYIMVAPWEMPRGTPWDRTVLERRMDGANQYISPWDLSLVDPRSIVGMGSALLQAPRLLIGPKTKPEPRPTGPLEERLPAEIKDRFVALREKLGQPAERYAAMTPLEASRRIGGDFRTRYPSAEMEVYKQVEATAKRRQVRVVPAYKVRIPATGYKVERTVADPAHGPACLDREMRQLEEGRIRRTRNAAAWANGDVRPMLDRHDLLRQLETPLRCFNGAGVSMDGSAPLARRLDEEFVASQVSVIERALKTPGRSVALLEAMSPFGNLEFGLLGRRGVLARLKAKGFTITTPPGLEGQ